MNFSPSPFWGGVLAVTFYQLVCTNPISFLSLGLGMTIGFVLTLYAVGVLVFRGYINVTRQLAESLRDAFREYPTLASVFSNYVSGLFDILYPTPNRFPVDFKPTTCGPPGPVCCPARVSPPDIDLGNINIGDIMKHINVGEIMKNIDAQLASNSEDDAETNKEETVVIPDVPNEEVPVVPDVPESCRGVHDADGNHIKEEVAPVKETEPTDDIPGRYETELVVMYPSTPPLSPEKDVKKETIAVVSGSPRKKATRSLPSEEPKPLVPHFSE